MYFAFRAKNYKAPSNLAAPSIPNLTPHPVLPVLSSSAMVFLQFHNHQYSFSLKTFSVPSPFPCLMSNHCLHLSFCFLGEHLPNLPDWIKLTTSSSNTLDISLVVFFTGAIFCLFVKMWLHSIFLKPHEGTNPVWFRSLLFPQKLGDFQHIEDTQWTLDNWMNKYTYEWFSLFTGIVVLYRHISLTLTPIVLYRQLITGSCLEMDEDGYSILSLKIWHILEIFYSLRTNISIL